jgi:hypothetical protein
MARSPKKSASTTVTIQPSRLAGGDETATDFNVALWARLALAGRLCRVQTSLCVGHRNILQPRGARGNTDDQDKLRGREPSHHRQRRQHCQHVWDPIWPCRANRPQPMGVSDTHVSDADAPSCPGETIGRSVASLRRRNGSAAGPLRDDRPHR